MGPGPIAVSNFREHRCGVRRRLLIKRKSSRPGANGHSLCDLRFTGIQRDVMDVCPFETERVDELKGVCPSPQPIGSDRDPLEPEAQEAEDRFAKEPPRDLVVALDACRRLR